MEDAIKLQNENLKELVARVSAKVADAVEMTQQAKYLSKRSEQTLKEASLALEELYVSLGDNQEQE